MESWRKYTDGLFDPDALTSHQDIAPPQLYSLLSPNATQYMKIDSKQYQLILRIEEISRFQAIA